jgi:AAA family ATP:ADP antiporter
MAARSRNPLGFVADLAPGERVFTVLMLAYFFLVTTTFWILKPLKKALFIEYYDAGGLDLFSWHLAAAEAELVAKFLNMLVAIVAMVVFSALARRLRRHRLSLVLTAAFIVLFVLYAQVLNRPRDAAVWSFYLVGDLFSTIMVAAFFAFLNDSVSPAAARRLYGPIGFGGVAGGVFGALVLSALIARLSAGAWLWICGGLGIVVALVAAAAGRAAGALPAASRAREARPDAHTGRERHNPALEGAALVLRSRYLLSIVAIVALYEIVSTVMDFQFTSTVSGYLEGDAIGAHMSRVFAVTNIVSLLVQLFVTGFVMSRLGVGVALLVLPTTALAASAAFLVRPTLWTGSLLNTADNSFNYSINQSAKEALYVPTSPAEKYQAKAFIDMFVLRFAKTLGIAASLGMSRWFSDIASIRWLSLVSIAVIAVWVLAARHAGRAFDARGGAGRPSEGQDESRTAGPRHDAQAGARR